MLLTELGMKEDVLDSWLSGAKQNCIHKTIKKGFDSSVTLEIKL